ncbi:flavocytochrome c [uncultured Adlercreutzia sp.]|uniref:flavocytochrome c n=1 Tax=uncultured Adlercreutzia sp. TaxID=875803 RepID=UPI0025E23E97|nr:flavocytochrome c [uncultured Adlercreutzia sp.]
MTRTNQTTTLVNGMSRRTFVKGAAVLGIWGGLASFGLSGCAPRTHAEQLANSAPWKAGTYTAEVTGHNAPYTMTVTFTDDAITAIDTTANQESLGVGYDALQALQQQVLDNQTINVDTVTGATLSSLSLQNGLEDCAKQAGAFEELEEVPAPAKPAVDATYDTDVCVIGGGGAGLAAAIAAVQEGANVIVLEKCGITGGSTNVSEGALNAVDPERQEPQGIEDSIPTFFETTMKGGHNTNNPELVHFLTDNALDSVHWLESLGVEFKDECGSATGSLGERSHYPATPSGNTYIRSFQEFIANNGDAITLMNDMQAKELITDEAGAVVGVKALYNETDDVTVNCKAVIIATGGFGGNVEYRQSVNNGVWKEVVLDESIGCTNIKPCAQGEGLALAEGAGAELICLSDIQLHPCGTPGTGLMEDIRTSGRNRIFVNTDGKRFVNEGAERDVLCKNIFAQPDGTYWIVVNTLRYPDPDEPDANGSTINNMLALGHIVAADTVEDLASQMGVDAANLQASIDAYNAVVDGGTDEFGFVADNTADAQMIEGPWYACRKVPTVHHTMGGIRVNVESEACDADGNPIPGLYAAGECTGGIHGENRLGGNAIADCMTFGRNAGTNAADYAAAA